MTKEEAIHEIEKVFEPAFANYIITALTEGATSSDKEQQPCEDCIKELIKEFNNKHPALFADYMREFNNHPISEIIEYMWDMHNLIEDIKYRLPNEGGAENK